MQINFEKSLALSSVYSDYGFLKGKVWANFVVRSVAFCTSFSEECENNIDK